MQAGGYDAWAESRAISPEARDLLRGLLTQHPDRRLTSAQVLGHPWLQRGVNRAWLDRHRAIVSAGVCMLAHDTTQKAVLVVLGWGFSGAPEPSWLYRGVNRAWLDRHRAIVSAEVCLRRLLKAPSTPLAAQTWTGVTATHTKTA